MPPWLQSGYTCVLVVSIHSNVWSNQAMHRAQSAQPIRSEHTLFPYGGTVCLCLACPGLWPPVWHATVGGCDAMLNQPICSKPRWHKGGIIGGRHEEKGIGPGVWWSVASNNRLNYCTQKGPEHKQGCDGVWGCLYFQWRLCKWIHLLKGVKPSTSVAAGKSQTPSAVAEVFIM